MDNVPEVQAEAVKRRKAPHHIQQLALEERRELMSVLGKRSGEARRKKRQERLERTNNEWAATTQTITERFANVKQTMSGITRTDTELDKKIQWLSVVIEVLQEQGEFEQVRRLDETFVKLIETRAKIESSITPEDIYVKMREILKQSLGDINLERKVMIKVAEWLDQLVARGVPSGKEEEDAKKGS